MKKKYKSKLKKIFKRKNVFVVLAFALLAFFVQFPAREFAAQKISERGDHYFNGGEYNLKKAENLYKTALKVDGENWVAYYQLARINLVQSRFENGIAEIDKALAANPENKRAYYVRGLLDGYAHNYTEAEKDFQNFIAWAPDEWAGYMDLSWVYINSGKYGEAVTTASNALVLFPDNIWLYANKGLAEYKLGKYEEAKTSLGIAKKLAGNLTSEDWMWAYPGNNSENAERGVEEIRTAIDYNLSLASTIDDDNVSSKIAFSDVQKLSKYAGSKDLRDGVALSACCSSQTSDGPHDCSSNQCCKIDNRFFGGYSCYDKGKWTSWSTAWSPTGNNNLTRDQHYTCEELRQCRSDKVCGTTECRSVKGTIVPVWSAWSPPRNTVCQDVEFWQSRYHLDLRCNSQSRLSKGTKNCNSEPAAIITYPGEGETLTKGVSDMKLKGTGTDPDGSIIKHQWFRREIDPNTGVYNCNEDLATGERSCVGGVAYTSGDVNEPSPSFHEVNINGLAEGDYEFWYRVRDNDNKWSVFDKRSFKIKKDKYTLTVNINDKSIGKVVGNPGNIKCGKGTIDYCIENYNSLTTVNLTATPEAKFRNWSGDIGNCNANDNACPLLMDKNRNITANFECIPNSSDSQYCKDHAAENCRGSKFPENKCGAYVCDGTKDCTSWVETGPED